MKIAIAGATGTAGRHVVERATRAGHEVVALSRATGIDVRKGDGLVSALRGVDVIIDVTNPDTIDEAAASAFYSEVAGNLQRVGAQQGAKHIVTLSIVGIDNAKFGYYAAKLAQERAAMSGSVPTTILRVTQFHELPAQLIHLTRKDSHARVLDLHSQTIAARTVAEVLIEIAEGTPQGRAQDLAGPEEADLVELGRRFLQYRKIPITIEAQPVPNLPRRALIPDASARIEGPTFDEWLATADAATLPV
jgi:uncharacterized protein YbjT (DUF2867 family)